MDDGIGGEKVFKKFTHSARKAIKSGKRLARRAKRFLKSKITGKKTRVVKTHNGRRRWSGYKLTEKHKKAISQGLKKYHSSGKSRRRKFKKKIVRRVRAQSRKFSRK